jgi:hypothetical protein
MMSARLAIAQRRRTALLCVMRSGAPVLAPHW